MKKETFMNTLTYEYDGSRKGAKYTLDGEHYMNHGDYAECLAKYVLGYEPKKDANTRFDMGEDIEELNASVKSLNCGLTDMKLADNKAEFVEKFFNMTKDEVKFIWVDDYADMVDLYTMSKDEFKEFTNQFGSWDGYANKIRFKVCRNKIIDYLSNKVA